MKRTALALMLAACVLCTAAAEPISFSGKVEASGTVQVYAPVGGTLESVSVREGQKVTADTVIATLKTTKVYAPEDGTVSAVFGQPGDGVDTVMNRYGGIVYLEGRYTLMVSTTISRVYDEKENNIVHPGEEVHIISRSRSTRGRGLVTTVEGSTCTVLVTSGSFPVDDTVSVCRNPDDSLSNSLGQGTISRVPPTAVSGSGSIVSFAVEAGEKVTRGQLLFETVEGSFDGLVMTGTEIRAGVDGVISSLSASAGGNVSKNSVLAEIYPADAVRVSARVSEMDLQDLAVGQKVKVELDWNQDLGVSYEGTVEMISALGETGEAGAAYPVYVSFTPDGDTRYGMSALVTTLEEESPETSAENGNNPETAENGDEQKTASGSAEEPEAGQDSRKPDGDSGEEPEENGTGNRRRPASSSEEGSEENGTGNHRRPASRPGEGSEESGAGSGRGPSSRTGEAPEGKEAGNVQEPASLPAEGSDGTENAAGN